MGVSGTLAVVIICSVMNQMIAGKQRSRTSLGLTDDEKRDFQTAWEIYRQNQKEPDDVINALITLFEERPEAQDYFPVVAGLPLSKMAEDAGVRNASLALLEDITTLVRALDDDEEVERIIRSKRERLRARGFPVEVMFLYPAGVLAESVIANQDLDMAKRAERAITKTIFAVSAMGTSVLLIGAMSDHLGDKMTSETERAMLKMTFATYPLLVEAEKSYNIA